MLFTNYPTFHLSKQIVKATGVRISEDLLYNAHITVNSNFRWQQQVATQLDTSIMLFERYEQELGLVCVLQLVSMESPAANYMTICLESHTNLVPEDRQ